MSRSEEKQHTQIWFLYNVRWHRTPYPVPISDAGNALYMSVWNEFRGFLSASAVPPANSRGTLQLDPRVPSPHYPL